MNEIEQDRILNEFNRRTASAFEEVYLMFFREIYVYGSMLYMQTSISAEDAIQDVFIDLWTSKVQFDALYKIKAYIYVAVKNDFKNYIVRNKRLLTYFDTMDAEGATNVDVFEAEIYSEIDEVLKLLPEDYACVIKLFLEGYKPSEIALKLTRTQQNIYNMKYEALNILKDKINKNKLFLLLFLLEQ